MAAIRLTKELYFTTSTIIDWMDVFTRPTYKHIIVDSLRYCQENKGLEIYAWVLMTNHLHMIVGMADSWTNQASPFGMPSDKSDRAGQLSGGVRPLTVPTGGRDNAKAASLAQTGSLPSYNGTMVEALTVKIPPTIEEQHRIASFFRSLDTKISLQTQRIEKLKQMKTACLSRMIA